MFPCLGGPRHWPLTGNVGFLRSGPDSVARVMVPGSGWSRARYPTLADALAAAAPYPLYDRQTVFAVGTAGAEWTVVLASQFPSGDIAGFLQARAQLNLGCDFAAVQWIPRGVRIEPTARFDDYRHVRGRLFRRSPGLLGNLRTVQVSRDEGRWSFDASGSLREFERPDHYEHRRIAQRLPLGMLHDYLGALGIPVDDPDWLSGPVVSASRPGGEARAGTWSTMGQLRRLCGYSDDGIPTAL